MAQRPQERLVEMDLVMAGETLLQLRWLLAYTGVVDAKDPSRNAIDIDAVVDNNGGRQRRGQRR
jgi:hypothetical protein